MLWSPAIRLGGSVVGRALTYIVIGVVVGIILVIWLLVSCARLIF